MEVWTFTPYLLARNFICFLYPVFILNVHTYKYHNLLFLLQKYSKLQFCDTGLTDALRKALLCYCELDTLAMVFIWEYFYQMCNGK